METIRLATWINAPVERCFLLSLSIDLHVASARSTGEMAIEGVTTGLIGEGEMVTFQGRHFGMRLRHTSRIETLRPYSYFRDVMTTGIFRHFEHDHHFAPMDDGTRVRDEVQFSTKWGPLGRLTTTMMRRHLTAFLNKRNAEVKRVAESEEWRKYLDSGVDARGTVSSEGRVASRWDGKSLLLASQGILAPRPPHG
jgi:ligand-binding SRPBCC domain-containing protein